MLRPVSVVNVVVDDRDAIGAKRARMRGGNGDVVEETESHRPVALCMMAGRTDQGERAAVRSAHDALDSPDCGAGREKRDLVRVGRREGVGIERNRLSCGLRQLPHIVGVVDARELAVCRVPGSGDLGAAFAPPRCDHVHHFGALRPFRVTRRRVVIGESRRGDENRRGESHRADSGFATAKTRWS
jgi:hypothetical protein